MGWGGRKESVPLTVYDLTENIYNIGENFRKPLEKGPTNDRTKDRKAKGKRREYSMIGLLRASFLDWVWSQVLREGRESWVGNTTREDKKHEEVACALSRCTFVLCLLSHSSALQVSTPPLPTLPSLWTSWEEPGRCIAVSEPCSWKEYRWCDDSGKIRW